jgi:hypothetical protein
MMVIVWCHGVGGWQWCGSGCGGGGGGGGGVWGAVIMYFVYAVNSLSSK